MYAVILAGGKGTRLKPYTTILPKPLMPIGDMPILEVVLRQLRAADYGEVTLAVGHLSELLQAFFGDGSKLGINIRYSFEDQPLGTVGPLALIPDLPDTFLLMNGDILTNLDYRALTDYHLQKQAMLTIATYRRQVHVDFGVLESDPNSYISRYTEKPTLNYTVSMGIYVLQSDALQYIPKGKYFDLPQLVQLLIDQGQKVAAYPFDGYWLDIGRPDDYTKAVEEFEQRGHDFLPKG